MKRIPTCRQAGWRKRCCHSGLRSGIYIVIARSETTKQSPAVILSLSKDARPFLPESTTNSNILFILFLTQEKYQKNIH